MSIKSVFIYKAALLPTSTELGALCEMLVKDPEKADLNTLLSLSIKKLFQSFNSAPPPSENESFPKMLFSRLKTTLRGIPALPHLYKCMYLTAAWECCKSENKAVFARKVFVISHFTDVAHRTALLASLYFVNQAGAGYSILNLLPCSGKIAAFFASHAPTLVKASTSLAARTPTVFVVVATSMLTLTIIHTAINALRLTAYSKISKIRPNVASLRR